MLCRNERTKNDAVRDFYEKNANLDDFIVKFLSSTGKFGIPIIFLVFAACYWIIGYSKYFSG